MTIASHDKNEEDLESRLRSAENEVGYISGVLSVPVGKRSVFLRWAFAFDMPTEFFDFLLDKTRDQRRDF